MRSVGRCDGVGQRPWTLRLTGVEVERGEGRTCTASFMVIGAFAADAMMEAPGWYCLEDGLTGCAAQP